MDDRTRAALEAYELQLMKEVGKYPTARPTT